jgi:hypothetical protein
MVYIYGLSLSLCSLVQSVRVSVIFAASERLYDKLMISLADAPCPYYVTFYCEIDCSVLTAQYRSYRMAFNLRLGRHFYTG